MDPRKIIGKECGDFTVEKEIGRGTFGLVYLVTRTDQRKACSGTLQPSFYAMKMVNISESNKKEKVMLEREVNLLRDLKKYEHKNIVKYIDFFTYDSYTCIVMEYCERGTLYEYIRTNKAVPEPKFIGILSQLASGLEFLHSKSILHRDVKSKNILIDGHNDIKIGDFGVARELPVASPGSMSVLVGSPQYMSPEMLQQKPYDEKTDIWSLGCTCYEMGIGDYAFHAKNISQIKELVEQKKLPPMKDANYCEDIKRLIMSMLQKESVYRPNARQVLETVQNHKCIEAPKIVGTVSPRPRSAPRKQSQEDQHEDSGLSSGNATPLVMSSVASPSSTLTSIATTDMPTQVDQFQNESCRYQSKLVRLIGDNRASERVSKIMRVLRKYPQNYDKIKDTVRKYVREDRYDTALAIVLALKGTQEAIAQMTVAKGSDSSSTSEK